jgi:hypothetical protein
MADCDLPAMQPLLAVFDAALAPILPYITLILDPGALDADIALEIAPNILPPALPALPALLLALQLIDVTAALGDLPPMPALGPFPPLGFGPLSVDGTINIDWDPAIQGLPVITTVVAMIAIPLDLIVGTLDPSVEIDFPGIIIASLPDFPGAVALAECIEEKLPMFA